MQMLSVLDEVQAIYPYLLGYICATITYFITSWAIKIPTFLHTLFRPNFVFGEHGDSIWYFDSMLCFWLSHFGKQLLESSYVHNYTEETPRFTLRFVLYWTFHALLNGAALNEVVHDNIPKPGYNQIFLGAAIFCHGAGGMVNGEIRSLIRLSSPPFPPLVDEHFSWATGLLVCWRIWESLLSYATFDTKATFSPAICSSWQFF